MLHLPETLSLCLATCRLSSHLPEHRCHIPARYNSANRHLLSAQHCLKGQRPDQRTESNDGDKNAPAAPPPSLSESHRVPDEAQISSDISAVACYRHRPCVLNQNVRAWAWQEDWGSEQAGLQKGDRGPPLFKLFWRQDWFICSILLNYPHRGRAKGTCLSTQNENKMMKNYHKETQNDDKEIPNDTKRLKMNTKRYKLTTEKWKMTTTENKMTTKDEKGPQRGTKWWQRDTQWPQRDDSCHADTKWPQWKTK